MRPSKRHVKVMKRGLSLYFFFISKASFTDLDQGSEMIIFEAI
jgi:hypothetical protein